MTISSKLPAGRNRLDGKVALVVGGGSIGPGWGNGKAAAVLYALEGAKVLVVDARQEAADETGASSVKPAAWRHRLRLMLPTSRTSPGLSKRASKPTAVLMSYTTMSA